MDDAAKELHRQYEKEFDDIYNKYRVEFFWTQEDIDNLHDNDPRPPKVGDISTQDPEQPADPKEAFTLFKNYFGQLQFIINKQIYIQRYGVWTLWNVENELSETEDIIKRSYEIVVNPEDASPHHHEHDILIEYARLKGGYYDICPISKSQWTLNSNLAHLYGYNILYRDFLIQKRIELLDIRADNAFSKKQPLEQLDLVLNWFVTSKDAFPHADPETIHKSISKELNYDYLLPHLFEILNKLKKDGYLESWTSPMQFYGGVYKTPVTRNITHYIVTWEGRYFISSEVGGYREESRLLSHEKKWSSYIAGETLKNSQRLNRLTLILAIAAITPFFYNLIEIIKHHPSSVDLSVLTSLFVFLSGICVGTLILLISKEVSSRRNLEEI